GAVRIVRAGEDGQDWARLFVGTDKLNQRNGEAHTRRTRALRPVFGRDAHLWYRDNAIVPTLQRNLADILGRPHPDGVPRVDLVPFGYRLYVQLAALLVGIDGVDSVDGAAAMLELFDRIKAARPQLPRDVQTDAALTSGWAAKVRFSEEYFG